MDVVYQGASRSVPAENLPSEQNLLMIDWDKMSRRAQTEPGHAAPYGRNDKINVPIGSGECKRTVR